MNGIAIDIERIRIFVPDCLMVFGLVLLRSSELHW